MKRFMKGCGVTALIFLVLGYVLGFVGGKMAGKEEIARAVESATDGWFHMYPNSGWGWHFYSDHNWINADFGAGKEIASQLESYSGDSSLGQGEWADRVVDSGEARVEAGSSPDDWNQGSYEIVQDKDAMFDKKHDVIKGDVSKYCPGEDIRELDIEVGGCQFYTEPSEDGRIYLEVGNAYRFQGYVEKGTLHIRSKTASMESWESSGCWIILYLPERYWFEEVEVELAAGSLVFKGLYADEVSVEAGAGEIDIRQIDADKLEVNVGAGYVWLTDMKARKLDAEIGLGGLTAEGAVYEKADLECSMGNIDLTLEGREEDFNYKLKGAMGNIDLGDNSYIGLGTEKEINNHASREIEAECSMGNITIFFTED